MVNINEADKTKLHNAELLRLAMTDSDEEVSVLIQPDIPSAVIKFKRTQENDENSLSPSHIRLPNSREQEHTTKQIEEISTFLQQILGHPPRWIRSAHSFVVSATPAQLRDIVSSPMVKSIWLNSRIQYRLQ